MLTCPNINLPEWQKLVKAVGKTEAVRDYLETDGLIRTPEEVLRKLETRKAGEPKVKEGVSDTATVKYKNALKDLPTEIQERVTFVDEVPTDVLGNRDIPLAIKDYFESVGILDPILMNWVGINKDTVGNIKEITSEQQLKDLVQKRYKEKTNKENYVDVFKINPIAEKSFNEWIEALKSFPLAFREVMFTHAIKYLTKKDREQKYVLELSPIALTSVYGMIMNKPNELNRLGKLYDQEVIKTTSDATGHEPSASGKGYWVHVPRVGKIEGYSSYEELKKRAEDLKKEIDDTKSLYDKEIVFYSQEPDLAREDSDKYGFQDYDYVRVESSYSRGANPYEDFLGPFYKGYYIHGYNTRQGKPDTKIVPITKEQAEEIWVKAVQRDSLLKYEVDDVQAILRLEHVEATYKMVAELLATHKPEDWADSSKFEASVELLRKLSPSTWCTATTYAPNYVENYDNYLLIVDGVTVVGIEVGDGGEVNEVTSRNNNGIASIDHLDDTLAFFEKHGLDTNNRTIQNAIKARDKGETDSTVKGASDYDEEYHDPPVYDEDDGIDNIAAEYDAEVAAITTHEELLQYIGENGLMAVATRFEHLRPALRNIYDIALAAVSTYPLNIHRIDSTLPFYEELVDLAMEAMPYVYNELPEAFKTEARLEQYNRAIAPQYDINGIDLELPFSKTSDRRGDKSRIQGYYDPKTDKVVIVKNNTPLTQVANLALHETAHAGMLRMAKELGGEVELYNVLIAAESQLMAKLPELLERTGHKNLESLMLDYGFTSDSREGKTKLLMELAARWAETLVTKSQPSWWKKLIGSIQNWLKQFTGKTLTEQEVNELVGGFIQQGAKQDYEALGFDFRYTIEAWKDDPTKKNAATYIHLKGTPSDQEFQVKKDIEEGFYSVHFKTTQGKLTSDQIQTLVDAVASQIPIGGKLSTWGDVSKGGVSGLNRFLNNGFKKVGERTVKDREGNPLVIPILEKVSKSDLERQVQQKFQENVNPVTYTGTGTVELETIVDADLNINWDALDTLQEEYFKGKDLVSLRNRPERHKGEQFTWDHTQNVVESAKTTPIPHNVDRRTLVLAAMLHDIGKPFRNNDHGADSVRVINDLFADEKQSTLMKLAIRHHMIHGDTTDAQYDAIIADAKDRGVDMADFIELLLALNVADIRRNRPSETEDEYSGMSVATTIAIEIPEKRDKLYAAALRQDAFDPSVLSISPDFDDMESYEQASAGIDDMPTVEQFKTARASEFANKLSVALGLVFEEITAEEATTLTTGLATRWNGEPAFFLGGKIYFIKGRMTTDLVFHEFAHPVIRAIAKANPELFAKLFNDLATTTEGQEIINAVRKAYPELDPDSPYFMEEVLVKSLERRSMDKLKKIQSSPGFMNFIQKFLYHMRQFMRQVFGRNIDVSKVDTDTMLDDLATVLVAGGKIDLNVESVTEEDIISFNREAQERVANDLMNVRNRDIQKVINAYYDTVSKHIKYLKENHNYTELERLLTNEFNAGELQKMKKNLHAWQTSVRQMADRFLEEVHDNKKRTNALAATLFRLDDVMAKIYQHVQAIAERPDSQENLHQMYYYMKVVDNWKAMIEDLQKVLDDPKNHVPTNSPINGLVGSISSNIRKIKSIADDVYRAGSVDALYDTLEPMSRGLRESYEKIFEMLTRKGAPQSEWDRHYKDYYGMTKDQFDRYEALIAKDKAGSITDHERDELKVLNMLAARGLFISKDKINYILKGQAGDANWFNSYLEGYLYNTDPVVGGLALYVKNQLSDVMIVAQRKYNDFARDLGDDIRKYRSGLGDVDEGWLGRLVVFEDITGYTEDKDGVRTYKEVKVPTFIDKYKNWRGALARWEFDLETAFRNMQDNTDASQKAYNDLYVEFKRFQQDYFYQPYTDAYYKRDDVFYKFKGDKVGNDARIFRDKFIEALRSEVEPAEGSQMDMMEATRKLDALWKEYRQKMSMYDIDGNLKTGEEAEIAQRLREYRDQSRDLYDHRLREGAFEEAYFTMIDELAAKGINKFDANGEINKQWLEAMNDWKQANTRAAIKPDFYDIRDRLIAKINEIMQKLPQDMQDAADTGLKWREILDKTAQYKDEDGQNVGTDMSDKTIAEIKALQEQIRWIRKNTVLLTNLTKAETAEYKKLIAKRKDTPKKFTTADLDRYNELKKKRDAGLSEWDIQTLYQTYQELHDLQNREATDYYLDTVNSWFSQMDMSEFSKYLNGKHEVDASTADMLLERGAPLHLLFDQSPKFQEWFEKNHMNVPPPEYEPKDPEAKVYDYERVYAWSVNRPRSLDMMEHYVVKDPVSGRVVDTIIGLPAMKYYTKSVKAEYRTPEIIGVTVDNKKTWLPRSKEDMAKNTRLSEAEKYIFINEKYEEVKRDPALFNILEKLKKHHLVNQEGLAYSSRLYLDLPRYMRSKLEMYGKLSFRKTNKEGERVNIFTDWMRRIKAFFTVQAESVGDILNYDKGFNLIQTDMFDNELTNIPISGLTHLEADDVSLNVTMSLMRYMLSAERQKQLVRISPIVRAIQASVSNPEEAIKELKEKDSKNRKSRKLVKLATKGDSVRKKAVDKYIEREFEGKTNAGWSNNFPVIQNFMNLLFKRASFSFFAFNIPSALKNSLGMKFQSILEGAGGLYVDQVSLQKGNADAYAMMGQLSFTPESYTRGVKSHDVQLAEAFDISQDRATEPDRWGGQMSRTVVKDIAEGKHWFAFRKAVEYQAGLQLSFGMLYKKVVTRTLPNGQIEKIPYKKAFEVVDGKLQLKSGIDVRYGLFPTKHVIAGTDTLESIAAEYNIALSEDPAKRQEELDAIFQRADLEKKRLRVRILEIERENEIKNLTLRMDEAISPEEKERFKDRIAGAEKRYDGLIEKAGTVTIENSEFKLMKNRMHQVANNLNGVYAKYDQPEAQRYLLFRTVSYMRRYFTGLAIDRWGFSGSWKNPNARRNPGMGDAQMGFYIRTMKVLVDTLKRGGKNLAYLTPQEIRGLKKFTAELAMLYLLMMLPAWLFGYDDDDEKRNEKLRKLSGPLNIFGVAEPSKKGAQEFSLAGFAQVHALHLLLQIRAEQDQFNPIMSGVKNYLQLLDVKSVALGPTVESLQSVAADIEYTFEGHKKARYERDVGPYVWQDKDQLKVWNHVAKMFGITGTFIDPAMAVANFESATAKVRR